MTLSAGLVVLALIPTAYVLEHEDQWTDSALAADLLGQAGFSVQTIDPDFDVSEAEPGLLVLGSFSSEIEGYSRLIDDQATELRGWIENGGVLLQLVQADQFESEVPLPIEELNAVRNDTDAGTVTLAGPEHPLLAGIGADQLRFHETRTSWETFADQVGFEVLARAAGDRPALMTATVGAGGIVLSSLPLDKVISPVSGTSPENQAVLDDFREAFFSNLHAWTQRAVSAGLPAHTPSLSEAALREYQEGSWCLVVMPDTQVYAQSFPGLLSAQTAWIRNNRDRLNIRYTLHLGDITNWNNHEQWRNARDAFALLDGEVPYALAAGNHDYGPGGNASTRETLLNEYFPFEEHSAQPGFGGAYEEGKIDNTFHTFRANGQDWLIMALEWGPRDEVVQWANDVMEDHPDHRAILITHAYMYSDETRYNWETRGAEQNWNPHAYSTPGGVNDGEELWQKVVRRHPFAMTMNGHVLHDGTAVLTSKNDAGQPVHQMLMNYQTWPQGGEGYLRVLEFLPDGETVRVKAYSPLYDRYLLRPDHSFTLNLTADGD